MEQRAPTIAQRALAGERRERALLEAAFKAFATYGFRRTSMEDIARGAGVSRSALYLHFRNKEDVFEALVEFHFLAAQERVEEALGRSGQPEDVLARALAAYDGEAVEALLSSPHGPELLDTKASQSAEIARAGEAAVADLIAGWIARAEAAGSVSTAGLGAPRALADALLAAKNGAKASAETLAGYLAARERIAHVFGRALQVTRERVR